jgi:hypothetical protein
MSAQILRLGRYKRVKLTQKQFWIPRVLQFPALAPIRAVPRPHLRCPGCRQNTMFARSNDLRIMRCHSCGDWLIPESLVLEFAAPGCHLKRLSDEELQSLQERD